MIGIEPDNPLGYSLSAIAQRQLGQFDEAMEDHNKSIKISPDDAELYEQRRQTHMKIANYEEALLDARKCVELQPEENIFRFHAFCVLVALGHYEEAKAEYEKVFKSAVETKRRFQRWSSKYAFDTLGAGLQWHPPQRQLKGAAFLAMNEADNYYRTLCKKAKRVAEGFRPTWSPDGTELAYSRGIVGWSGIEILNLESGKPRLLTIPGKDPAWSPDGKYIVYIRDRKILPLGHLTAEREIEYRLGVQEEVWIIKADGTEEPRFLARGGFPGWSSDSKHVFYHSRVDMMLCSISIEDGAKPIAVMRCPHYFPVVSPDDKYVAYEVNGSLQIVDLSSQLLIQSWTGLPRMRFISWSPNGRQLCLGGSHWSGVGLWIYNVEAKKGSKVLSGWGGTNCWSPDGTRLAFALGPPFFEIWVADTAALRPGRTLEEHYQEMVDFYARRIQTDPEDGENYLLRAIAYIWLQEYDKATADLERCAKLVDSGDHPALQSMNNRARTFHGRGQYQEAEQLFVKVLAI